MATKAIIIKVFSGASLAFSTYLCQNIAQGIAKIRLKPKNYRVGKSFVMSIAMIGMPKNGHPTVYQLL
jgi:hypothetical protein